MKTIKELETMIEDKLTALEMELYEVKIEKPSFCPSLFNRRLSFVLRDRVRVAALMRQIADAITLVEESNPEFFDFATRSLTSLGAWIAASLSLRVRPSSAFGS